MGAGLDPDTPLQRASSQANEVWLAPDFVLRVNFRGDIGRLRREYDVAHVLPPAARYPGVAYYGTDGQIEWIVGQRVPGVVLSRVWPTLSPEQRRQATHELGHALATLHAVAMPSLPGDADLAPPHILPLPRLVGLIHRVAAADKLDNALARDLEAFVRERWDAFDDQSRGLVHGDPHLENVLWDGERISAVLDLEWSRNSWLEVDLETLLSFYNVPERFVSEQDEHLAHAEDYRDAPGWLAEAHPDLFAHPRLSDRLTVLHISRVLTIVEEAQRPSPLRTAQLRAVLDATSFLYRVASA